MTNHNLPDNLKSRLSRVYVAERNFKNDKGENIDFQRLVLEIIVKGEVFNIEYKPEKKDVALLKLADIVEGQSQL